MCLSWSQLSPLALSLCSCHSPCPGLCAGPLCGCDLRLRGPAPLCVLSSLTSPSPCTLTLLPALPTPLLSGLHLPLLFQCLWHLSQVLRPCTPGPPSAFCVLPVTAKMPPPILAFLQGLREGPVCVPTHTDSRLGGPCACCMPTPGRAGIRAWNFLLGAGS